jgi:uncharacterized NAD(P)/FAD-binding protein YdhS
MVENPREPLVVAVVGAGAAGTLTAAALTDLATDRGRALRILLIDPAVEAGRGVAYSTSDARHLLNVAAAGMSAHPDQPDHFLDWLAAEGIPARPGDYVARCHYGRYLAAVLDAALLRAPDVVLQRVPDRVVGVGDVSLRQVGLTLRGGAEIAADAVVLAMGLFPPGTDWAPEHMRESRRFVADPWAPGALDEVRADARRDVLLVGTGLTMVDVALTLAGPARTLHAVSRRGLLPRPHVLDPEPAVPPPEPADPSLDGLRVAVRAHVRAVQRAYGDWRPGVDGFRPHVARLWQGLTAGDRARFLLEDAAVWDAHRHRMAPASSRALNRLRAAARLRVEAGEVRDAYADRDGLRVTMRDGTQRRVGWVVNCTGPLADLRRVGDPLIDALLDRGVVRPGPVGLGLLTDEGRVRSSGDTAAPIWTLGALRRGELWESTAMPEIRAQAVDVASRLLSQTSPPPRRPRPTDVMGLPLSTTPEAAGVFNDGLEKVMLVQSGAEESFRWAAELDPGFALAHAALALLGHEAGADVDVEHELSAALQAASSTADDRERSFVDVLRARVRDCRGEGAKALLRHVAANPRDALAVGAAVPTIAFSGATDVQREVWHLVEGLAPAYGPHWWYAGLLAFVRLDQGRYDEAAGLADLALDVAPSSGHAVHARTHVYYETGQHWQGLRWLDPWISVCGRQASHRAHFAWHAALHELSTGDLEAMRRRYVTQLAPPLVTGMRSLVDSASLLWRARVTGAWPDSLPIEDVLAAVDEAVLTRPESAFVALHSAVALAAAGNLDGLGRLGAHVRASADPAMRDVIAPVCAGLADVVRSDWASAAARLRSVTADLVRVGGSAAQREVVEETLLFALVNGGEAEAAAALLDARLDRRPSPLDRSRRMQTGPVTS